MNQTKIKFPAEVARAPLAQGLDIRDRFGHLLTPDAFIEFDFPGVCPPYTLASDKPLTQEQAQALGEAWPGSVWTDGKTLHRFRGGTWNVRHPGDNPWHEAGEMGWAFALPTDYMNEPYWHLVSGPEVNPPAAKPEPKGATLLDCMRYAKDNQIAVWVERLNPVHGQGYNHPTPIDVNSLGVLSTNCPSRGISVEAMTSTDWTVSQDQGETWFNPNNPPKPQIKPRTGAELRRWLVENPGREAVAGNGLRARFTSAVGGFELHGEQDSGWVVTHPPLGMEFVPADGKDW